MLTLNLTADEKALFEKSAEAVRKTNNILHEIKALQTGGGWRTGIRKACPAKPRELLYKSRSDDSERLFRIRKGASIRS